MARTSRLLLAAACSVASAIGPFGRSKPQHRHMQGVEPRRPSPKPLGQPGSANCTTRYFTQTIDHFGWVSPPLGSYTYQQRYLTFDQYWNPSTGAIFFYAGNEADVTLYADHTGLIWENAQAFGAYVVFAEHRYYGLSQPFGSAEASLQYPQYLTHEQAQADYAALAFYLTNTLLPSLPGVTAPVNQPIILFGGSYGGMLAAWTRTKYPGVFQGAIAASAPVRAFQGMQPAYDAQRYWQVVTRDATAAAGSTADCAQKVTSAFSALWSNANTAPGLARLSSTFGLCTPLATPADVNALAFFLMGSWDTMAMGNFPYPSNYLTGGGPNPDLPAWPVRAACSLMSEANPADPWSLLAGLNAATGMFNNVTGTVECYNPPSGDGIWEDAVWDIQWCTELLPEETYFPRNGAYPAPGGDMFWAWNFTNEDVTQHCMNSFGYTPRFNWIAQEYGMSTVGATNIVFSNGEYDPWSSGGVNVSTAALPSIWIAQGAHHLDLFFSNPQDPASVTSARATEMGYVRQWISDYYAGRGNASGMQTAQDL